MKTAVLKNQKTIFVRNNKIRNLTKKKKVSCRFSIRTRCLVVNNFDGRDLILIPIVFRNNLKPCPAIISEHSFLPLPSNIRDNHSNIPIAHIHHYQRFFLLTKILRNLILCDRQYRRRVTRTRQFVDKRSPII